MRRALWPGDPGEHRAELEILMANPRHAAFIARSHSVAIGFAEATLREFADGIDAGVPAVYLDAAWADPAHRRRGVAAALLDAAVAWGVEHGARAVGSDTDIGNPDGEAWHRAMGFAETGRTINFARAIDIAVERAKT